jgi:DNA polymerase V
MNPMKSASIPLRQQQSVSRHHSEWLTSDNLQLPILELSQLPMLLDLPLFGSKIPAGFPSPADDHLEATIDLNRQFVRHPAATFFVRVKGFSMIKAGIHHGDMLIVDRSLEAQSRAIVLAIVNGEFTLKRLVIDGSDVWLMPENPEFQPLQITEGMELQVWGVVAHVIHSF